MTSRVLLAGLVDGGPADTGPALDLIDVQTLAVAAAAVNFTAIPEYEYLVLRGHVRSAANAAAGELALRLGGAAIDTGNNYRYAHYHVSGGVASSTGDSHLAIGRYTIPGGQATAGVFGELETVVHAATGVARVVRSGGRYEDVAGGMGGIWNNSVDPIARMRVFDNLGANLAAGSTFALYGTDDPAFINAQAVTE